MPPLYDYDIALRFSVTNRQVPLESITAFLNAMPAYLQDICRRDLNFCVQSVQPPTTPTDVVFWISVIPRTVDPTVAEQATKMGIKNPEATGTYADVMLWLGSLRRLGDSPLQVAWNHFRLTRPDETLAEQVPVVLVDRHIAPRV